MEPLIGRREELAKLQELVAAGTRCAFVVGAPGIGKTALVRHWAGTREAITCTLAPQTTQRGLYYAIAIALGLDTEGTALAERVQNVLASHGGVLVLDQVENLQSENANRILQAWLAVAPRLQLIAITRRPLAIEDSEVIRVPPLALPAEPADLSAPAAELFLRHARKVVPELDLPSVAETIVRIVQQLDGVPLALELAAHSLRRVSAERLLRRLESGGSRLPAGLDAAINGSWELLGFEDQRALSALSALESGFDVDAAQAVAATQVDIFPVLDRLVSHCLLRRESQPTGGARFSWLSPIRAFAAKQSADREEAMARAARYFSELEQNDLATHDIGNLERLLEWAMESDESAETAVGIFLRLASLHYPESTSAHAERLRARFPETGNAAVDYEVRYVGGRAAMRCQRWALAGELLTEAIELAQSNPQRARALVVMGRVEIFRGSREASQSWTDRIDLDAELGHRIYAELGNLKGAASLFAGELKTALHHQERALEHAQLLRDAGVLAQTLANLTSVHFQLGAYGQAVEVGRRAVEVARESGSTVWIARTLATLGGILAEVREPDAEEVLREAIETSNRQGEPAPASHARMKLAHWLRERDDLAAARRETVLGLEQAQGIFRAPLQRHLGIIAHQAGEYGEALEHYDRAIETQQKHGMSHLLATSYVLRSLALAAVAEFEAADRDLAQDEVRHAEDAAAIARCMIDVARAQSDGGSAIAAAAPLSLALQGPEQTRNVEQRFVRRLAEEMLSELATQTLVIRVRQDGSEFSLPGGETISLVRRRALGAVLAALASHRIAEPGGAVGVDDLCAAGWPGERINRSSARRRLYVTISELRKMGLKESLLKHGGGYLLDPSTTSVI